MTWKLSARIGVCAAIVAMVACDGPRVESDAGGVDSGRGDAGPGEDSGTPRDSGPPDTGSGEDAGPPDTGLPDEDGGTDSGGGDPDAGTDACVPVPCGPTECGTRDDGCGTMLACGLCGIGGPCADDAGCRSSMTCLTEEENAWESGYCSRECRYDSDCTATSHCAYRGELTRLGICVSNCTDDSSCRTGYACFDADGAGVTECAPTGSGTGAVGERCTAHSDCAGGTGGFCFRENQDWREGYCSIQCGLDDPCPSGSHCAFYDAATDEGVCLANCTDSSECRADGYLCEDIDGDVGARNECFPAGTGAGEPGTPCAGVWDCGGGFAAACFGEDTDRLGGYCILVGCSGTSPCPLDTHCGTFTFGDNPFGTCTPNCTADTDCRAGYACYDANGDGSTECWMAGTGTSPVGGTCEGIWDCAGREQAACIRDPAFPGGYCLTVGCAGGCPAGSHCAADLFSVPVCLDDCGAADPCRGDPYRCVDDDGDGVNECMVVASGTGLPGEPCRWRYDCAGGAFGFCIFQDGWPGGYCTQECAGGRACPAGSLCLDAGIEICLRQCASDSNCRVEDGYECVPLGTGDSICYDIPPA